MDSTTLKVGVLVTLITLLLWGGRASLSPFEPPPPAVSQSSAPTNQLERTGRHADFTAPEIGASVAADWRKAHPAMGETGVRVSVHCEADRDLTGLQLVLLDGLAVVAGAVWEGTGVAYISAPGLGTFHIGVLADSLPGWADLLPLGEQPVHVWGRYLVPGSVHLAQGVQSSITMTVAPRGEVDVLVLDASGYPLPGVSIVLVAGRTWGEQERLLSDSSGVARASNVGPGEHLVRGISPVSDYAFEPRWIRVEGGRPTLATLSLKLATSSVTGLVVDSIGEPLPGVMVEWHSSGVGRHRERTEAGGSFCFSSLVSGNGQVVIPRQRLPPNEDGRAVDLLDRLTAPSVSLGPSVELHVGSLAVATRDSPVISVQLGGAPGVDLELFVSSPLPEGATRLVANRLASRRLWVKGGEGVHLRRPQRGARVELTLWEKDTLIARLLMDWKSNEGLVLAGR